jgi:glucokinase
MCFNRHFIGIDIGGSKTIIAVVSEEGEVLNQKFFLTDVKSGPLKIIKNLIHEIKGLQTESKKKIQAIGIGIAGQVLLPEGIVKFAPNLYWHLVPLKGSIEEALNLPTVVMNDVRAATWGECKFGAGKGFDDILCLMIGTGIGGGVITRGTLLEGSNNSAGELGHFPLEFNGPKCTCGNNGCLEALAGGWAIAKRAKEVFSLDLNAPYVNNISAKDVLELLEKGDSRAAKIIDAAIRAIVVGCIGYVNVFNPSLLIIGGGLGLALPNLISHIEKGVREKCLGAASEKLKIVKTSLLENAVTIGSAAFSRHCINTN